MGETSVKKAYDSVIRTQRMAAVVATEIRAHVNSRLCITFSRLGSMIACMVV